jgi:RNase P subunit RPR2
MIKIIKQAQRKETARTTCHNCHSVLEYAKGDVKTTTQYNREEHWIKCPVCSACIDVNLKEFGWIDPAGYYEDN